MRHRARYRDTRSLKTSSVERRSSGSIPAGIAASMTSICRLVSCTRSTVARSTTNSVSVMLALMAAAAPFSRPSSSDAARRNGARSSAAVGPTVVGGSVIVVVARVVVVVAGSGTDVAVVTVVGSTVAPVETGRSSPPPTNAITAPITITNPTIPATISHRRAFIPPPSRRATPTARGVGHDNPSHPSRDRRPGTSYPRSP